MADFAFDITTKDERELSPEEIESALATIRELGLEPATDLQSGTWWHDFGDFEIRVRRRLHVV